MKKLLKTLCACAAAALLATSCSNVLLDELGDGTGRGITRTLRTAVDVFTFAADGYNSSVGPISIVKGTLSSGGTSKTVYLVGLSGTQMKSNQATGLINDLQAGFSVQGAYCKAVKAAITSKCPAGSNLILAGHSLGGMIAQQIASDSGIKASYNVLNTVTFGSPLIDGGSREGTVKRLGDSKDPIPYLSYSTLLLPLSVWNVFGLNREDGGYGLNVLAAHNQSYKRTDLWGSYSALGAKWQTATIGIDDSTRTWYAAPAGWKW